MQEVYLIGTEVKLFNSQEFGQLRGLEIDGEPWFVGKDVADALRRSLAW